MIIKGTIEALGVARRGACEAAKALARLESWLLELQREEDADCARDVWPGKRDDGETNDCCGTRGNVHTGDCETHPARVAAQHAPCVRCQAPSAYATVHPWRLCGVCIRDVGRGSAVDRASASLGPIVGGYDGGAHCVVCGLACGASRCEWCARAEAAS